MVALMTHIFSHKWKTESKLCNLDFGIKNIHQHDNPRTLSVHSENYYWIMGNKKPTHHHSGKENPLTRLSNNLNLSDSFSPFFYLH